METNDFIMESLRYYTSAMKSSGLTLPGGSKYTNISWKIVCCEFSKELLSKNPIFTDDVLRYAGIYIQIKYDLSKGYPVPKIYVGKADLRNNNTSFLSRNKEHRKSNDHDYDIVLWFTHEDGRWAGTEIGWLENYLKKAVDEDYCDNGNTPSKGAGNVSKEIVRQIVGYINYLGYLKGFKINVDSSIPEIITQKDNKTIIDTDKKALDDIVSDIDNKNISKKTIDLRDNYFGLSNYTTPADTVREMVNKLPKEIFNKKLRVLDLSCKGGEFLYEFYQRLHHSEHMDIEDDLKRYAHIVDKQLYGIALSKKSYNATCKLMYYDGAKAPNILLADEEFMNIMRGYVKVPEYQIDGSIKIRKKPEKKTLEEYLAERFREINDEGENVPVKFDVIIGNPPYNDSENRGDVGSGNSIYPFFMKRALELSKRFTSLVVPAGWMTQYPPGIEHSIVDKLRRDSKFTELHDFKDCKDVFSNVSIPTGVCYYLTDKENDTGLSDYYIHEPNSDAIIHRDVKLYNPDANVIFRDSKIIDIIDRIDKLHKKEKRFNEICAGAKHHFDDGKEVMESKWNDYSICKTNYYNIKYFVKSCNKAHKGKCTVQATNGLPSLGYGWVNKGQIPKNANDFDRPKILVGQAFTAGSPQVMDVPEYVGINCVCSHSYLPIFSPHDTEEECLVICKYIKTKFFRYLVNCMKTGQNMGNVVYSLVPMQNFTNTSDIDWTKSIAEIDQQLYKKYGLTDEEIAYIEATIKPM